MASLIARVRLLINDTGGSPQFTDQQIQDVMDETRTDVSNQALTAYPTYTGATIQYLDYYAPLGLWEDGYVLKQYLTVTVTPSAVEPIVGHFSFAATTLPPVYITGSLHDTYRAAADLLERMAAMWTMAYNANTDGQSMSRSQVMPALLKLADSYRRKQRAHVISFSRSDIQDQSIGNGVGKNAIDYMASGDGR
jgi:hypothetical protein